MRTNASDSVAAVAAGTRICQETDVEEGAARGFLPQADAARKVIVVRRGGRLYGWLDSCPHYAQGTPLAWRTDAYLDGEGRYLACHAHGARFEIETGDCISGPCLGQRLTPVPLAIAASGEVLLAADLCSDMT